MADILMPDLVGRGRTVRHQLDSALLALLRLGMDLGRVVLEAAGPGEPVGQIVAQDPGPGATVTPGSRVVLRVGGSGGLDMMPFPLRDEHDTDFRADRLFAIFDNPALKLGFFLRQGGAYLALHADEPVTARRWLEDLFAVPVSSWPPERWHPLARLVPMLHAIGGTAAAVRVAMLAVFGLPVADLRVDQGVFPLAAADVVRLGERRGRLGFDAVLGGGVIGDSAVLITYGPVALSDWRVHATSAGSAERSALFRFLLPAHLIGSVRERWQVGDAASGVRLAVPDRPALLGVNSYLGSKPVRNAA